MSYRKRKPLFGSTTKTLVLFFIDLYQQIVSPWLGNHCRFYPSCSEWAKQAFRIYGTRKGFWLTLKRLLLCHPFHTGGYDPLPLRRTFKNS